MKIKLSETEKVELKKLQHQLGDKNLYIKVTILLMLDKGRNIQIIAEDLGIDDGTIYRYISNFQNNGLDKYLFTEHKGYWGLLSSEQISRLRQEINNHLHINSHSIRDWIQENYNIKYTTAGVIRLLHRIGYSYKQTKAVPCEANGAKQEIFLQELEALTQKIEEEQAVIYYIDGVHPTHNTRETKAWIETGTERELPTVSGRDRVNINGAVNAHDVTDVQIIESQTINAQSTQELYEKIMLKNSDKSKIYIISDNARYYKNNALKEWLMDKPIVQIFLPPYSPNLNIIERLWKFMRKKVINTNFYRTKERFKTAILDFFTHIADYKQELVTLLTLKFQLFHSQFNL